MVTHLDKGWIANIIYILLARVLVYLFVMMDVSTRTIRGWELSR